MIYLAYGSNLDLNLFKKRCPNFKLLGSTMLENYQLVFKGEEDNGYLTVEPKLGSQVPIGIFEISKQEMILLDQCEGYPYLYSKRSIKLLWQDKEIWGTIYIMNKGFKKNMPTVSYLRTCLNGYDTFEFNIEFLTEALRRSEETREMPNR